MPADAQFLARIKSLEQRRQIAHNALKLDLDAVDDATAIVAIALEGVDHAVGPLASDHQTNAPCDRTRRRVRDMRRHEDVAIGKASMNAIKLPEMRGFEGLDPGSGGP
jgi:hypothetical protein